MLTRLGPCRTPFLFLAIFLHLVLVSTYPAYAGAGTSTGCTAINGGYLDSGVVAVPNTYDRTINGAVPIFSTGDSITATFNVISDAPDVASFSLTSSLSGFPTGSVVSPHPVVGGTALSITLVGPADTVEVHIAGPVFGIGSYSVTATCTPGSTLAPTVTSVSPTSGTTAGGTAVTITGTNFTGATAVTIGGTAATGVSVVDATTITATTPAHAAGTVDVVVTTPGGTGTGTGLYTYIMTPSTTSVSSSKNPSEFGQSVTFTATVSVSGTPTGTVTFKDGATVLATVNLSGTTATFTTSSLALGTHSITATYNGDSNFTGSTSAVLLQAVNVPADSLKLRAMQITVTPLIAQISGQAIAGAIDNAIDAGFSDNVQPITPNGSGFTFNFGAEGNEQGKAAASNDVHDFIAAPDRRTSRIDDVFSALAYGGNITKAPPRLTTPQRDWLGWIDVRGTSVDRRSTGNDLKGDQINATAGLTRKLTPDFLVGAFGGYEHFDYSSDALTGRLKGDGWTVGSYLGWRFTSTMRFDLALARSGIDFNGTAGTASATFPGSRWLVSSGLTGTYRWQALVFQPSARIYALWEHENGYTDSLGTVQTDRHFSTGRASAGAKLSYPFVWTSTISLAPYAGVYGDYYFTSDDVTNTGLASTPLLQGWSARFISGLAMKLAGGGQLSFGGELGGIGGNTTIWTYRARGSVPF